jgi:hypothetical protein
MIFIHEPKPVVIDEYKDCIDQVTQSLSQDPNVQSIYQIGGLSAPGISDIDLVVIFNDEATYLHNPRSGLSKLARYLYVHKLFGTSKSLFEESKQFTFFHNYNLLYGKEQSITSNTNDTADTLIMKRQWAREYLVRMLVNMAVEKEYDIYKLRNMLLQGRALIYDLEFLGANAPQLSSCLERIIRWRNEWFITRPSNKDILELQQDLWRTLVDFLDEHLKIEPLFMPTRASYYVGRNIELKSKEHVCASSLGPKLKWAPKRFARRLISLQHRFNKFTIDIPFKSTDIPPGIAEVFDYTARAHNYNNRHLPHFMPLTSSLVIS